ncbi:uncharacterized protein LOC127862619 [Dreissena polymorpha]|uniref:uncharacterized protein LOC127862619 n=1 Tax=Dreissena polymorpha TaxID=45954 RepID=UPI00226482EA|nr:uncharacterized protein LOC127862619 [Dreissena polymorpha]
MDRVHSIRLSRKMALAYVPGHCHLCQQANAKVRRLKCGRHNYCRMCGDLDPRLVKGDYSCKKCSEKLTKRTVDRRAAIDNFLFEKAGYDVNYDQPMTDDLPEQTDLDGNNSEWEHLLKPFPVGVRNSRPDDTQDLQPIPRKSSFLHLTLPSAQQESSHSSPSPVQPTRIEGTVTQLLGNDKPSNNRRYASEKKADKASNSSSAGSDVSEKSLESVEDLLPSKLTPCTSDNQVWKPTDWYNLRRFEPNPSEVERCSSPCKSVRPRSAPSWCEDVFPRTDSQTESEALRSEIGDIEGPGFSASSSRSGSGYSLTSSDDEFRKNVLDDFWDSFV